ncbi:unnamed protein product [Rotaria sp. Silwood2]|nr:unnamed protein product [Rotaria sp. Silwood2]CAF4220712.1 unnamed protein product [Rotaria sp. Silwood2]CAF4283780.1 unnamed protein product [Rotaria sp. Silwood2]
MGGTETRYVTDPALLNELQAYRKQNEDLMNKYAELVQKIQDQDIDSFEDLEKYDAKAAESLIKLAQGTVPIKMEGRNFGFFGATSTGKSTMINKLLNKNVAATGAGETTKEITKYDCADYFLYDVPGKNDDISYFSMQYISFWKGLTGRLVLIRSTLKEMTKVFRLLDAIGLHYDVVVNRFDEVAMEERDAFKQQINNEVTECKLKGVDHIWFLSARNPPQFPDWIEMVDYLTKASSLTLTIDLKQ